MEKNSAAVTSVNDPKGNVTSYAYDDFKRMRQQVSPVSGTTTYAYDEGGNLVSTTDANGATTARVYDALNRVTSAVSSKSGSPSETVTWSYDGATSGNYGIGRLASMTDPTGSTTYVYERRGLLRQEAKTIGTGTYTTQYGYDADGNRATAVNPSGRTGAEGWVRVPEIAPETLTRTRFARVFVSRAGRGRSADTWNVRSG